LPISRQSRAGEKKQHPRQTADRYSGKGIADYDFIKSRNAAAFIPSGKLPKTGIAAKGAPGKIGAEYPLGQKRKTIGVQIGSGQLELPTEIGAETGLKFDDQRFYGTVFGVKGIAKAVSIEQRSLLIRFGAAGKSADDSQTKKSKTPNFVQQTTTPKSSGKD